MPVNSKLWINKNKNLGASFVIIFTVSMHGWTLLTTSQKLNAFTKFNSLQVPLVDSEFNQLNVIMLPI